MKERKVSWKVGQLCYCTPQAEGWIYELTGGSYITNNLQTGNGCDNWVVSDK